LDADMVSSERLCERPPETLPYARSALLLRTAAD
jgi:hypothetical protein